MNSEHQPEECCPPFIPDQWHEKEFTWTDKHFVKTKVSCILYMPLNFGGKMRKIVPLIEAAGASMPDGLVLSEQISSWRMDLFVAVDKNIPDLENVSLSGRFISKVYEGPYQNAGKWYKDFKAFLTSRGIKYGKIYFWYAYCPKCAKKYGANYSALIGEIL